MDKVKGKFRFSETENITTVIAEGGALAGELYYAMSNRMGIRTLLPRGEEYHYDVFNYNRKGASGESLMPKRGIEVTTPNDALQVIDHGGLEAVYYCMVVSTGDEGFADLVNFYDEKTFLKLVESPGEFVNTNYAIRPVKVTNELAKEEKETEGNTQNPYKDAKVENEELYNLVLKMQKEKQSLHNEIVYLKLVNDSLMNKKEEVEQPQEEQEFIGEPELAFVEPKRSSDTAFIVTVQVITLILGVITGMLLML